jgi:hypothetical protein
MVVPQVPLNFQQKTRLSYLNRLMETIGGSTSGLAPLCCHLAYSAIVISSRGLISDSVRLEIISGIKRSGHPKLGNSN